VNTERPCQARLAELGAAVAAARARVREAETAHQRALAEIARFKDVAIEAYSVGDEPRAAKASKERARLEGSALRDASERVQGAQLAATTAEDERGRYAAERADELLHELEPDARAAAQAVEDAVEALTRAHSRWNEAQATVANLLRSAGRDTGTLPEFPGALATLVRDARRAGDLRVPPPLPGGRSMIPSKRPAAIPASLPKLDPEQKPTTTRQAA